MAAPASADAKLKVAIMMGSVRAAEGKNGLPGRLADRVANLIANQLRQSGNAEVRLIDPAASEYRLPLLENPAHWRLVQGDEIPENLTNLLNVLKWADAYVLLTPEYNFTVAPALVNMLDHVPQVRYGGPMGLKPCMLVSYSLGKFGGVRAVSQLRTLISELGPLTLSNSVSVAEAWTVLSPDGVEQAPAGVKERPITDAVVLACKEMYVVGRALRQAREEQAASKKKGKKAAAAKL